MVSRESRWWHRSQGRRQALVLANVTLYALCYQMQSPVLPYMVQRQGEDLASSYAKMQTVFNAAQFVGGLLSGPLADRTSPRLLFTISFVSSMLCYAMTAMSTTLSGLMLSRLPTVLQHAVLAARALISETSSDEMRAQALGYIGFAYGIGLATGPTLGGNLSQTMITLPAWIAAIGSFMSAIIALCFIGDAKRNDVVDEKPLEMKAADGSAAETRKDTNPLAKLYSVVSIPGMPALLLFKVLSISFPVSVFHTVLAIAAIDLFDMGTQQLGFLMSYMGIIVAISQGFLIGWIIRRLGETNVLRTTTAILMLSLLGFSFCTEVWQLFLVVTPISISSSLVESINTAQLTRLAPRQSLTSIIAVDMSLASGLSLAIPSFVSSMIKLLGYSSIGMLCAAVLAMSLVILRWCKRTDTSDSDKKRA